VGSSAVAHRRAAPSRRAGGRAARAGIRPVAGVFAVAVTTTHTAAELTAADVIVPDLTAAAVPESAGGLRVTLSGR